MTTYAAIRQALATAEWAGLPVPSVEIFWHNADDETARAVIDAFPGDWYAKSSGRHEWLRNGHMVVFLPDRDLPFIPTERAEAILAACGVSA